MNKTKNKKVNPMIFKIVRCTTNTMKKKKKKEISLFSSLKLSKKIS